MGHGCDSKEACAAGVDGVRSWAVADDISGGASIFFKESLVSVLSDWGWGSIGRLLLKSR